MAASIQVLLTLTFVEFIQGHLLDSLGLHLLGRHHNGQNREEDNAANGDIYSYNHRNPYDNYYGNRFNKPLDPYFGYPGQFNRPNFDNMPLPGFQNKYPGQLEPLNIMNIMNGGGTPIDKFDKNKGSESEGNKFGASDKDGKTPGSLNDNIALPDIDGQKSEDPKTNNPDNVAIKITGNKDKSDPSGNKNNLNVTANKDYLLVDNNGNNAYLLHEDVPNTNQPGNNVMYVPVTSNKNTLQPGNQYYPSNGQPTITSIPLTGNTLNGNYPLTSNVPLTGNYPLTSNVPVNGNYPLTGNVPLNGNYPLTGNVPVNGNYPVTGNVPLNGNYPLTGNVPVNGNYPVTGNVPLTGNYPLTGNIPVNTNYPGNIPVTGNIPNTGNIPTNSFPINNQPNLNNVLYVQQPNNQIYQLINGQLVPLNNPITGSSNEYNNFLPNPAPTNPPLNNYNPGYIYVYANGQLMQVPGYIMNAPQNVLVQNGYNSYPTASVPSYNVPNGYTPMTFQVPPTNNPISNNNLPNGVVHQNLPPNGNTGVYNMPNGYAQPDTPKYNTGGAVNNPGSAITYPGNNNGNRNPQNSPSAQKEPNISSPTDVPLTNESPKTAQVLPVVTVGNNYIQPAVMFSDFKDKEDDDKEDSKGKDKGSKEEVKGDKEEVKENEDDVKQNEAPKEYEKEDKESKEE